MSRQKQQGPSLFDVMEPPPAASTPPCMPRCWPQLLRKTYTVWPGETWERLTWTCELCGTITGRC